MNWWVFSVKNRTRKTIVSGGFEFKFKNYDLVIRSISSNFELRIRATEWMFGYLAAAMAQGKEDQLKGYATMMYILSTQLGRDRKFNAEVTKSIEQYMGRLEKVAEEEAKNVADAEIEKAILQAEKDNIDTAKMSRRERRERRREVAKVIKKEILKNE